MLSSEEIDHLIKETMDVGNRVKTSYNLVMSLNNKESRATYTQDLLIMIEAYKDLCLILKNELDVYIKEESKNNKPINLIYRKIFRCLSIN